MWLGTIAYAYNPRGHAYTIIPDLWRLRQIRACEEEEGNRDEQGKGQKIKYYLQRRYLGFLQILTY